MMSVITGVFDGFEAVPASFLVLGPDWYFGMLGRGLSSMNLTLAIVGELHITAQTISTTDNDDTSSREVDLRPALACPAS